MWIYAIIFSLMDTSHCFVVALHDQLYKHLPMDTGEIIAQWVSWYDHVASKEGKKFTQSMLAGKSGLSPQYISRLITGDRSPSAKTVNKIASALDITPAEFYAGPPSAREEEPGTCTVEREFVMPHQLADMDDDEVRLCIMRAAQKLEGETLRRYLAYGEGLVEGSRDSAKKNIKGA